MRIETCGCGCEPCHHCRGEEVRAMPGSVALLARVEAEIAKAIDGTSKSAKTNRKRARQSARVAIGVLWRELESGRIETMAGRRDRIDFGRRLGAIRDELAVYVGPRWGATSSYDRACELLDRVVEIAFAKPASNSGPCRNPLHGKTRDRFGTDVCPDCLEAVAQ